MVILKGYQIIIGIYMQAVWYNKFGPAKDVLEIGEYQTPQPKRGEVKVRIYASGVNPSDTKKRLGANPALLNSGSVIPNLSLIHI